MTEIDELKEFRAALDEAVPGALARARSRVLADVPAAVVVARPGRAARLMIPAVAVAVVLVVLTVSLAWRPGPARLHPLPAATSPVATSPPPLTAADIVKGLADRASAGAPAPAVRPGQRILVTERDWDGTRRNTLSYHVDPNGLIMLDNPQIGPSQSFDTFVAEEQAAFAQNGPSLAHPSPSYLATLDADPEQLQSLLFRPIICAPGSDCTRAYKNWEVFADIEDLFRQGDVIIPPAVRAGLLRLVATFTGLTAEPVTADGHAYVAVGIPDEQATTRSEMLVDPATGRVVGDAQIILSRWADGAVCSQKLALRYGTTHVNDPLPPECAEVPVPAAQQVRVVESYWSTALS
jgi:hypothetical protein